MRVSVCVCESRTWRHLRTCGGADSPVEAGLVDAGVSLQEAHVPHPERRVEQDEVVHLEHPVVPDNSHV